MTNKRIGRLLMLLVGIGLLTGNMEGRGGAPSAERRARPALHGNAALAELERRGQYDSLHQALAAARYRVHPERQRAAWHADNPAHQIRASFTPDGVQVETTTGDTLSRRIGMTLRSVGYGERQMGVGAGRVTTTGNRIEYARALVGDDTAAGAIAEWYVNTPAGLEQGFTLDSAPGARRPGERLRVVLAVDGALRAQGQPDGQALAFVDEAGRPVLHYDHLVVTDARGRELAARMDAEAGRVGLELDDRDAVYPITIDPIFTLQQKLEASDAAEDDLFGVSVAISGETVVVGASRDDGAAGGNQGSAYVFVRSGGAWSLQQKLEASDAAADDEFGFSVAISGETVVVGSVALEGPRLGLCLCAQRWSLDRAAEAGGPGRGGR